MMITKQTIHDLKPCAERWKNYLENYSDFKGTFEEFLNLDKISYQDKICVSKKILKREALEHPGEKKYGISSKRMVLGIFKKAGYILTIVVATMVDILMDTMMEYIGIKSTIKGSFCLLITVWFILGEAISILENASRMGVKVPRFFRKIISELQKDIDGKKS